MIKVGVRAKLLVLTSRISTFRIVINNEGAIITELTVSSKESPGFI
jgi:hypothetical protein